MVFRLGFWEATFMLSLFLPYKRLSSNFFHIFFTCFDRIDRDDIPPRRFFSGVGIILCGEYWRHWNKGL